MTTKSEIILSECLLAMRAMPECSFDAIVTDPPAGIEFMGKVWDSDRGGRDSWIAWMRERAIEMLRVLKPGGHALVWALPRTSHWTATALEDAGFELRDRGLFLFGSGFPKSHRVDNDIDKLLGCPPRGKAIPTASTNLPNGRYAGEKLESNPVEPYEARTPEGARWSGYGSALKPAVEDWWLCRKPLSEGTLAANVLRWGTGALNIDGCRIGLTREDAESLAAIARLGGSDQTPLRESEIGSVKGRWPAHLVLAHDPRCVLVGTQKVKGSRIDKPCLDPEISGERWGTMQSNRGPRGIGDENGEEEIEVYACVPGCPVRMLDDQVGVRKSGMMKAGQRRRATQGGGGYSGGMPDEATRVGTYGDEGSVSRFFYASKASRSEREAGLRGSVPCARCGGLDSVEHCYASGKVEKCLRCNHPTVKNLALMRWLCRLVTPPGGRVLDPFAGSGSTGCAAIEEGFEFVGIEQDAHSVEIARARMQHVFVNRVIDGIGDRRR